MRLPNALCGALTLLVFLIAPALAVEPARPHPPESFFFGVDWRFVRAGDVQLNWDAQDKQAEMKLRSVGLVATFIRVEDTYRSTYDPGLCVTKLALESHEGRRNRDVKVTFDRATKRASYLEKDLNTGAAVGTKEIEVPDCVHDVLGALHKLRQLRLAPGSAVELPVSDGKKVIMARVEAQQHETLRTPLGQFQTTRYEAFLFNGAFYARKGRLFLWLSDDDRRLPLQIRVQMPFYIGTVTLQLEKYQ